MDEESRSHRPQLREKVQTPTDYTLSRRSMLNLHWNTPLADFIDTPGALFEPDVNPTQTLGSFLSGEDGFHSYKEFRASLRTNEDKDKLKRLARNLHEHFPFPKELLEQNPDMLNWVPWHAVIAYGKYAGSRTGEAVSQSRDVIGKATKGDVYTKEMHEAYPKGYIKERTEILLHRQNANARIQGVLEAIANSIDAVADREKIGQFGIGVKQLFTLLESTDQTFRVVTKEKDGEVLVVEVKKGYDDDYYIRYTTPGEEDRQRFATKEHGTIVEVIGLDLNEHFQHQLRHEATERFEFVAETDIHANREVVNDQSEVQAVGRNKQVTKQGAIGLTVTRNRIAIEDPGAGMNRERLFRMMKPGGDKEFVVLTDEEAEELVRKNGEVLFKRQPNQRFVVSRNREVVFAVPIPPTRLGLANETICLELGRALNVSEGREGFEIDMRFVNGVAILTEKVIQDDTLNDGQKATFLNSMLIGLDQLNGQEHEGTQNELAHMVLTAKKKIREAAKPFIQKLISEDRKIMPNYAAYGKVMNAEIYLDPYLLVGTESVSKILQSEGYSRLKSKEGVRAIDGWTVFTAPLRHSMQEADLYEQLLSAEGLHQLRVNIEKVLPVMLDSANRIALVDETLWAVIASEPNETRKVILQEALQIIINERILTGYEQSGRDPRTIFIEDTKHDENVDLEPVEMIEELGFSQDPGPCWYIGDRSYRVSTTGYLSVRNVKTNELEYITSLGLDETQGTLIAKGESLNGCWLLDNTGTIMFVNLEGNITARYDTPVTNAVMNFPGHISNISIREDGLIIFELTQWGQFGEHENTQFITYNPATKQKETALAYTKTVHFPFLLPDNTLIQIGDNGFMTGIRPDGGLLMQDMSSVSVLLDYDQPKVYYYYQNGELYMSTMENITEELPVDENDFDSFYDRYKSTTISRTFKITITGNSIEPAEINNIELQNVNQLPPARNPVTGDFVIFDKISYSHEARLYKQYNGQLMYAETTDLRDDREMMLKIPFIAPLINFAKEVTSISKDTSLDETAQKISEIIESYTLDERVEMLKRLEKIYASAEIKAMIMRVYTTIQDEARNTTDVIFARDRFMWNLVNLAHINPEDITEETIWVLFDTFNSFPFFKDPQLLKNTELALSKNTTESERRRTAIIIENMIQNRSDEDREILFSQLHKVMDNPKYRTSMFNSLMPSGYLEDDVVQALSNPLMLDMAHPARAWLLFLTNNSELILNKESVESKEGFKPILPPNTPLEVITYLRIVEGLVTVEEMNTRIEKAGGVDAFMQSVDLTDQRHAINVAIHGQAVGTGIEKRELMQNGFDAVLASRKAYGKVSIDFYYRGHGNQFVEEFSDNGTGITDHVAAWVPGDTTKEAKQGSRGFFGSGFYREFKHLVHHGDIIERDSTTETDEGFYITREIFDPIHDGEAVVGVKLRETLRKKISFTETGTVVRIVKDASQTLGELESMLAKTTYLTMGGMAASPEAVDMPVPIYLTDSEGKPVEYVPVVSRLGTYQIDEKGNTIRFVKSPQTRGSMTSGGLFMNSLDAAVTPYTELVHPALKQFMLDERISAVASPGVPLIKDRSRFADEEKYIPQIQEALAGELIKQTAFKMLHDSNFRIPGMPEDLLSNPHYVSRLTGEEGDTAFEIATKLNRNESISREDAFWVMSNKTDNVRLILVLMHIEYGTDKKDSLLRRMQLIQLGAGNQTGADALKDAFNIKDEETDLDESAQDRMNFDISMGKAMVTTDALHLELLRRLRDGDMTGITRVSEITLPDKGEIELFFQRIGFDEVFFVQHDLIKAGGFFDGTRLVLSDHFLKTDGTQDIRARWNTLLHENAHLWEYKERGVSKASMDVDDDRKNVQFTHQQDGAFGRFNRIGAYAAVTMLKAA